MRKLLPSRRWSAGAAVVATAALAAGLALAGRPAGRGRAEAGSGAVEVTAVRPDPAPPLREGVSE